MNIKGYIQPKKPVEKPDYAGSLDSIVKMSAKLEGIRYDVNSKLEKVDSYIEKAETTLDKKIIEVDKTIKNTEDTLFKTVKEVVDYVKEIKKGEPGENAQEVDVEQLVEDILAKLPVHKEIDEEKLIKKVIKAIPQNKASLKIVQESFETDPMSVIDEIMKLPDNKFKLKSSQIDGLDQTIRAFQSQLARGYLHGGGDTVKAGTNITITKNTDGSKTINSTGGGTGTVISVNGLDTDNTDPTNPIVKISVDGSTITGDGTPGNPLISQSGGGLTKIVLTGTVNGNNNIFTALSKPTWIVSDGVWYEENDYNGNSQWTYIAGTITTVFYPQSAVWGF